LLSGREIGKSTPALVEPQSFNGSWAPWTWRNYRFGFLITSDGFGWGHRLPAEWVAGLWFFSKQLVRRGVRPLQIHFQRLLSFDETVVAFIWDHFLRPGQYREGESATKFWERQRSPMIPDANGLRHVPYRPVADTALIASRLPCSEAGVERTFSRLGLIFGSHRRSIQDDLADSIN
jgi:hypothetical protein